MCILWTLFFISVWQLGANISNLKFWEGVMVPWTVPYLQVGSYRFNTMLKLFKENKQWFKRGKTSQKEYFFQKREKSWKQVFGDGC